MGTVPRLAPSKVGPFIPGLKAQGFLGRLCKLSCADVHSFSLLEESNTTRAEVVKALPYLEAKAKGDKSME
jgi:hypothetical protein